VTLDRPMVFYTTDKKTMNIYVKLVIDVSENPYIKDYVNLEKASDFKVVLVLIAPNKETYYLDGELLEQESLHIFNLGEEYINKVGNWDCELRVYSTVANPHDEIITSNRFIYTVKASITHDLDDTVFDTEEINLLSNLVERIAVIEKTLNIK
jgi:hypothetical protein